MVLSGIWRRSYKYPGWRSLCTGNTTGRNGYKAKTCGIIVTGDEVLKGEVQDTNSHFLSKNLHDLGIKVVKISSVPDDVDIISAEVKKFSGIYDYVLTTGGIGPTHDDVTYESVAKAFGVQLKHNEVLTRICFDFFKTNDMNHPALKLALVPVTSRLTFGFDESRNQKSYYPNVSVENVFIFPGVPQMMRRIFNSVKKQLFSSDSKFYSSEIYLSVNEDKILDYLNDSVRKYPEVTFGSYPQFFHSYYALKLTAESSDRDHAEEAFGYLKSQIPGAFIVSYDKDFSINKSVKVDKLNNKLMNDTINNIKNFVLAKNRDDVFLYFDGGKNSTLLLYMLSVVQEECFGNDEINCVYTEDNSKVIPFITESKLNYNINLIKLTERNLRRFFMANKELGLVKGTRKSDPDYDNIIRTFEGLNVFNPLLDWSYKQVWEVLRGLCIPYCDLYNRGYSSISKSSKPNPHLKTTGPRKDLDYYKKAHELPDDSLEAH